MGRVFNAGVRIGLGPLFSGRIGITRRKTVRISSRVSIKRARAVGRRSGSGRSYPTTMNGDGSGRSNNRRTGRRGSNSDR